MIGNCISTNLPVDNNSVSYSVMAFEGGMRTAERMRASKQAIPSRPPPPPPVPTLVRTVSCDFLPFGSSQLVFHLFLSYRVFILLLIRLIHRCSLILCRSILHSFIYSLIHSISHISLCYHYILCTHVICCRVCN